MARIRSIKPEFWRSPSTAKASPRARLLYIAMWNWADDYGVGEWTPRELLGFAFPNDDDVTSTEFQTLCTEVATCFGTVFYLINGRRFYCIPAWDDHQKNERRAQGKYPRPDASDATKDADVHRVAETHGTSVQTVGHTASGTGNREQGNRGTGNSNAHLTASASFDDFWEVFPKKNNKADAEKAWAKAIKMADPEQIIEAARVLAESPYRPAKQFIPYGATWLNRKQWNDPPPEPLEERSNKPTPEQRARQTMALAMDIDMKELGQ